MAKLYFRYGAMGSSKTANALMVRYNYLERGKSVLLLKPSTDTRDGVHRILSRCGLEAECTLVEDMDLEFLSKEQVETFAYICDMYDVPVICYGLKTDFQGNFFEGSHWLLARADAIEEVKTICWCGRKATQNARLDGKGSITKVGEQVVLGANDTYIGLCRKHWRLGDPGPGLRAEDLKRKGPEEN